MILPSMWTSIYVEVSPEDAVRRIAGIGFPAIELGTEHLEMLRDDDNASARIPAFGQTVADVGLKMDQAHITITVDIASLDDERRATDQETVLRDIDLLATLGISTGVLHPGGTTRYETLDDAPRHNEIRREAITRLARAAEDAGVRLALENGTRTFGPGGEIAWSGDAQGLRDLITEIGSPALGITIDTGHAILEGWDVAEAIRVAGDLLIATHIADNDGSGDQHRIPYSYGSKVDWVEVVRAIKEVNYDGPFNLEIPGERQRPYEIIDATLRKALEICDILLGEKIGPQPEPWEGD